MNRRLMMIISVTGILLVFLLLIGLTYAYFETHIKPNENQEMTQDVTVKELAIMYADGTSDFTNGIILPGYRSTKTFTITNNGDERAYFSIILDNMKNTFQRNQDLKYRLSKNTDYDNASSENKIEGNLVVGTHQILMPKAYIEEGETATYYLELIYENLQTIDQSEDMAKTLEFRVNITDEAVTWDSPSAPSYEDDNAVSLIGAIQRDNQTILNEPTIAYGNGSTAYTTGEIVSTEDDYGTSYFFRGNPTNNYVTYSNMCWRILRIQGDGTIKLILTDKNNKCTSSTSDTFTANSSLGSYAWFMETPWYNTTDYSFQSNEVFNAGDTFARRINNHLLTATDWCMDGAKAYGSSTWDSYSYNRIYTEKEFSLKCNREGLDNINATRWNQYVLAGYPNILRDMYVGVITVDEAIFSGVSTSQSVKTFLTSSYKYLTMTPSWSGNGAGYRYHAVSSSRVVEADTYVRGDYIPVVVLKNNVIIKSGNGTRENPYIVY